MPNRTNPVSRLTNGSRPCLLRQAGGFESLGPVGEGLQPEKLFVAVVAEPGGLLQAQLHAASPPASMPAADGQDAILGQVEHLPR